MAALTCIDRSTQCLLTSDSPRQPPDFLMPYTRNAHLNTTDTNTDPPFSPTTRRTGRGGVKGRGKGRRQRLVTRSQAHSRKEQSACSIGGPGCQSAAGVSLTRRATLRLPLPVPPHSGDTGVIVDVDMDPVAGPADCTHRQRGVKRAAKKRGAQRTVLTRQDVSGTPLSSLKAIEIQDKTEASQPQPGADHNVNACEEENVQVENDLNANARKTRVKRVVAKRRHVRSATLKNAADTRVVNFSALKPMSATCSRSGLGLVVTYRPVFTEATRKKAKRTRKKASTTSHINSANNNTQTALSRRESGTNPRTPSPEKRRRKESSPSFFEQIKSVIKRQRSSERDDGVKKWLRDIPRSRSPRVRKHRSPSPTRDTTLSAEDRQGPFTVVNRSVRKSPIPGPSWDPEELRQRTSRSRSPFYMPARHAGSSPRHSPTRGAGAPRPSSPRGRSSSGPVVKEVFAMMSPRTSPKRAGGRRPPSPSLSPPRPCRPAQSEGWDVARPSAAARQSISPPDPHQGQGERHGQRAGRRHSPRRTESAADMGHVTAQRDHATSVSKTRHYVVSRSRSNTRSPRSSHSSKSPDSRAGGREKDREGDYWAERSRRRHRRSHRRRHFDRYDDENVKKGLGACQVM